MLAQAERKAEEKYYTTSGNCSGVFFLFYSIKRACRPEWEKPLVFVCYEKKTAYYEQFHAR
jgi:hypothetical protein